MRTLAIVLSSFLFAVSVAPVSAQKKDDALVLADELFRTPTHSAAAAKVWEWLRGEWGAPDPNEVLDSDKNTFMHYAVTNRLDILREAVRLGGDCNRKNAYGATPLHFAAAQESLGPGAQSLRILLRCEARPGVQRECARGDKTGAACRGNPNVRDRRGNTPLHVLYENVERHGNFQIRELPKLPGAAGARADILKVLLQEAKADPNIRNVKGDTPLMALIRRGHTVFTKTGHASMLLGHGADPNTRNNEGETPLFEALSLPGHSRNSDYDMKRLVKLLIKHGADPDLRDTRRDTPLIRAAKHEDDIYAEIKELLAGGADPCLRDRSGKMAYDHAKKGSSVQLLLYKAGGYVDRDTGICRRNLLEARKRERKLKPSRKVKREGAGRTAWKSGRYAEALKQWRASAKKGDRRAMAALGRAFVKGVGVPQDFVEAHKWLNLAAARGDAKAAAERDALAKEMTAEERTEARNLARAWRTAGSRRVTAILPRRRAQGATRPQRRTVRKGPSGRATLRAVAAGDVSALKKALAAGADPNTRGGRGWTPLMYAANKGYKLLIPPLLKAGAKPNLQAADGATALFIAVLQGHSEIIAALMKAGANPRIKGPKGMTALDVAHKKGMSPAVLAFRDCPECPEMVSVPAGSFMMGSPSGEKDRSDDEGPRHRVTISKPFAIGKYEVTFDEWDACAADGGCGGHRPDDEGWGHGRRPVINVSWDDAKAYVKWLSKKTGKRYRLLSEAEWEYAARSGTTTPFHFGRTISTSQANYDENSKKTVPVGSYPANSFGLHDMHGNVWEWVEDCWNGNYRGAPSDGSAWMSGDCSRRVLRGGGWYNEPGYLRTAIRILNTTSFRSNEFGFRIARTLNP